jgi:ribulose-5-phosphate 4-epimerase/fuculose-1-phosphate aldolase
VSHIRLPANTYSNQVEMLGFERPTLVATSSGRPGGEQRSQEENTMKKANRSSRGRARARSGRRRIPFDRSIGELLLRYARMVVARGYIHNTLGNIAIRVPHPDFPDGIVYTKHSEVSLEEMTLHNIIITDIPRGELLHGTLKPSVGHQLNREILRLRPDINAVIHVHHDETIAFLATRAFKDIRVVSLEFPYVMAKAPYIVGSHLDVEQDVSPIKAFIQDTNSVVMENHGVTTLGRTVSEAYHRLNTLTSEVRRNVLVELLSAVKQSDPHHLDQESVDWMYKYADRIIYPGRYADASLPPQPPRAAS